MRNQTTNNRIPASYKDPSGHVFTHRGVVYRHINEIYEKDYRAFIDSGLYKELVEEKYVIPHTDVTQAPPLKSSAWKIIKPEHVPFISYPYEWSFGMLKDAALLTLDIQRRAVKRGLSLKDASAFNIQFVNGKPILIDTLSFERYTEGKPWVAYKQFVEHFLCPLSLAAYVDVRLLRLMAVYLDGIPLELASHMLPIKSRLNMSILFHVHTHASTQKKYSQKKLGDKLSTNKFSKRALLGMLDNLEGAVKKLSWKGIGTQWEDYYEKDKNNYKTGSLAHKAELTEQYLKSAKPKTVWDMGANTGYFSDLALKFGAEVISFDIDYGALEQNYKIVKREGKTHFLPLFSDITNPTPAVGWENTERLSLFERGPADVVMALALTHHLAITHNMPFENIASAFSKIGKFIIVEFIDKLDSQVQILLANRVDIFTNYTQKHFEKSFKQYFKIKKATPIKGTKRILYLMERL